MVIAGSVEGVKGDSYPEAFAKELDENRKKGPKIFINRIFHVLLTEPWFML